MKIPDIEHTRQIEHVKNWLDFLKHITTLATGAIVLQVAFLEKIFAQPKWRALVVISLISFMLCVVASVVAHAKSIALSFRPLPHMIVKDFNVTTLSLIVVWLSFLAGVVALTVFAIRNLFA